MAKKVAGYVKLQVPAGAANPSPPIGPALGQRGLNIMEFCNAFNAKTAQHLRHVGTEDDAGADARKSRSLFVNPHRKTGALQEACGAQAAEAGADDGYPCRSIHD